MLGDVLLSVGFISYLGAFTGAFRDKIINESWIKIVKEQNILCNEDFNLSKCIGNFNEI